jgi:hypothetical protein
MSQLLHRSVLRCCRGIKGAAFRCGPSVNGTSYLELHDGIYVTRSRLHSSPSFALKVRAFGNSAVNSASHFSESAGEGDDFKSSREAKTAKMGEPTGLRATKGIELLTDSAFIPDPSP